MTSMVYGNSSDPVSHEMCSCPFTARLREVSRLIHFAFLIPQLSLFHRLAIIIVQKKDLIQCMFHYIDSRIYTRFSISKDIERDISRRCVYVCERLFTLR